MHRIEQREERRTAVRVRGWVVGRALGTGVAAPAGLRLSDPADNRNPGRRRLLGFYPARASGHATGVPGRRTDVAGAASNKCPPHHCLLCIRESQRLGPGPCYPACGCSSLHRPLGCRRHKAHYACRVITVRGRAPAFWASKPRKKLCERCGRRDPAICGRKRDQPPPAWR